jgi:hypothetical protein
MQIRCEFPFIVNTDIKEATQLNTPQSTGKHLTTKVQNVYRPKNENL